MDAYMSVALGMLGLVAFVALIVYVFHSFVQSRVMVKLGQPSWKGWVPLYDSYTFYKEMWDEKFFFIGLGCNFAYVFLTSYNATSSMQTMGALCVLLAVIISFMFYSNYAKAFGFSSIFALVGIFLPLIFDCIIAFGSSEYLGYSGGFIEDNRTEDVDAEFVRVNNDSVAEDVLDHVHVED